MTGKHATTRVSDHELMARLLGRSESCPRCTYEGKHARRQVAALPVLRVVEGGAG